MLPRLRDTLDFMPSPLEDTPGLLIRDPFQFSDATLIVPPAMIECLGYYDGQHSVLDLRAELVRMTGQLDAGQIEQDLSEALSMAGFLDDDAFHQRKAAVETAFREASLRLAAHAGSGYPEEAGELRQTLTGYLSGASELNAGRVAAIAAPHVSPFGGAEAYRAAYSALSNTDADRTFVILGTSHYGAPNRFGLTRKPFATPMGETIPATELIDELARSAEEAVLMEDYCHSIEHSIEFQVVFLQHLFGPKIRVLPVLCGPYLNSIYKGGLPEDDPGTERFLGGLGEIAAREGEKLLWVLGVDMAHMGRRYGDRVEAVAGRAEMEDVERRDRSRIARLEAGDAAGFWEQVQENQDDLKWCGSAPLYTFLKALPEARGTLLRYQQWNIDMASVVTFAGMRFHSR